MKEAEISGQPGYRRKRRKSHPPARLSALGDNPLSNGTKQISRCYELPDVINQGKVRLPTQLSEETPHHGDPRVFCKSINRTNGGSIHLPSPLPFILSLWQSQNSGLFLNHWQHNLSWKYGGFLTWADTPSEEAQSHPACPSSPRLVGQRGLKDRAWGGSLPPLHRNREHLMLVSTAGITNCGYPTHIFNKLLHPLEGRLRLGQEPAPRTATQRQLKAGRQKNKLQMPILASFKEKKD